MLLLCAKAIDKDMRLMFIVVHEADASAIADLPKDQRGASLFPRRTHKSVSGDEQGGQSAEGFYTDRKCEGEALFLIFVKSVL